MGKQSKILFATTNPGKLVEVQKVYSHYGYSVLGPADLGITLDVEEVGTTLAENALLKAQAYAQVVGDKVIVIADDTGIEIDALGGKPGIHVRRWKGYKMEDEDIILHCLAEMKDIPEGERGAQFRTVLAIIGQDKPVQYFEGVLRGEIVTIPRKERREGMPFWPLFYIPNLGVTLGEFHASPIAFQLANPTHRERAVELSLPYLATLLH